MNDQLLTHWFENSRFGGYLSQLERAFLHAELNKIPAQTLLQIGMTSWQLMMPYAHMQYLLYGDEINQVMANNAPKAFHLPWPSQSIDMIIWPHGMDKQPFSTQLLAEIQRVLVDGGKILITGFNPAGYWRLCHGREVLSQCQLYKASNVISLLQKHQFVLSEGRFLGYSLSGRYVDERRKIELMGNRWWPHLAAIYALVLEKRTIPLTIIPSYQILKPQPN